MKKSRLSKKAGVISEEQVFISGDSHDIFSQNGGFGFSRFYGSESLKRTSFEGDVSFLG